jgi:hypothetical protein
MAIERNFTGFEFGDYGELTYGSGGTSLTSVVGNGTARSGTYHLSKTGNSGSTGMAYFPAGTIVGTSGTVSSGNHKRVSARGYFRWSNQVNNGQIRLFGFGSDTGTCTVFFGAQNSSGGFTQAGTKIGLRIGAQSHQAGVVGAYPWGTVDLTTGVWYRLLLDIDLDVAGTTVLSATCRITEDSTSPTVDFTLTNSTNIGATDNIDKLAFGYSTVPGAFGKRTDFDWDDVVYIATSDADAVSGQPTLPTQTHIYAIVPPTGQALNQWSGTFADVNEYPMNITDTMSSSTALAEVQFTHATAIALGYREVQAMKLYVNALASGAGTGVVDYVLNGVAKSATLGVNYPGAPSTGVDPIGGILWSTLTAAQFSATTFGIKKQNGTQATVMTNIGLEVIGTLATYDDSGTKIRGETQIKAGSIYDAQIADAARIKRHKIDGFGGGVLPVFLDADGGGGEDGLPGPPGPTGATGATGAAGAAGTASVSAQVLLATLTASASASLDFATRNVSGQSGVLFQSDFDEYLLEFVGLQPATNAVGIQVRMSTNGGSSYASGAADYRWSFMAYGSGGPGNTASTGASSISVIGFANISNNVLNPTSGYLRIFNPLSTAAYKMIGGHATYWDSTPTLVTGEVVGAYQSTTAVNALQVFMSSGNITAGTVRVYGITKSSQALATLQSAAAGALVFLEEKQANSSATLDFTSVISSAFDEYVIEVVNCVPATTATTFTMRVSTDGGSSYVATGYRYAYQYYNTVAGINGIAGSESATYLTLGGTMANTAAAGGISGSYRLFNPGSATLHKQLTGTCYFLGTDAHDYREDVGGKYPQTTVVNALRFMFDSGNIATGTVRIYGVAKSANVLPVTGSLILLGSLEAASSATLDFATRNAAGQTGAAFASDFDEYVIELVNVIPATNAVDLFWRFSTDGGATYDTSNLYAFSIFAWVTGASATDGAAVGSPTSAFKVRNVGEISNDSKYGVCGTLRVFSPLSAALYKRFNAEFSYLSTGPAIASVKSSGEYQNLTAINAFRFLFSSGNIASGKIRYYGVAK